MKTTKKLFVLLVVLVINPSSTLASNLTIVLLGTAGTGKSSLGNVLLGRDKNFKGYGNGCFHARPEIGEHEPVTKAPCMDIKHFLGNSSLPLVRIIDTPGFGYSHPVDDLNIEVLIDFLMNKVKSTTIFLILFKEQDKWFNTDTHHSVNILNKMFGKHFWNHVMIEATFWNYNEKIVNLRKRMNPKSNETSWGNEMNSFFKKFFKVKLQIPTLFIDSYYDPKNEKEMSHFKNNTQLLLDFMLGSKENFIFENINVVRTELGIARSKYERLTKEVNEYKSNLTKLRQDNLGLRQVVSKYALDKNEGISVMDMMVAVMTTSIVTGLALIFVVWVFKHVERCLQKSRITTDDFEPPYMTCESPSSGSSGSSSGSTDTTITINDEIKQDVHSHEKSKMMKAGPEEELQKNPDGIKKLEDT